MRKIIQMNGNSYLCNDGTIWERFVDAPEYLSNHNYKEEWKRKYEDIPQDDYVDETDGGIDNIIKSNDELINKVDMYIKALDNREQESLKQVRDFIGSHDLTFNDILSRHHKKCSNQHCNVPFPEVEEGLKLEVGKVYENRFGDRFLVICKVNGVPILFLSADVEDKTTSELHPENGRLYIDEQSMYDLINLSDDQSHDFILSGDK